MLRTRKSSAKRSILQQTQDGNPRGISPLKPGFAHSGAHAEHDLAAAATTAGAAAATTIDTSVVAPILHNVTSYPNDWQRAIN